MKIKTLTFENYKKTHAVWGIDIKEEKKQMVIKRALGNVDYKELPIQKRIQIDQKIVAKKRKVIDKIAKKLLLKIKAKEPARVKAAKAAKKARLSS